MNKDYNWLFSHKNAQFLCPYCLIYSISWYFDRATYFACAKCKACFNCMHEDSLKLQIIEVIRDRLKSIGTRMSIICINR